MPTDPHLRALRIYGALCGLREDWGGQLILLSGPGAAASLIAPAATIAGAATLLIEDDAAAVKAALRRGELDFVVNTLDEALRTLKNEIRQKRPLAVGLIHSVTEVLGEADDRGLLPDLFIDHAAAATAPTSRPTLHIAEDGTSPELATYLESKDWREAAFQVTDTAALRLVDARLFNVLPEDDIVRRRWLSYSGAYLRRAPTTARNLFLNAAELETAG